MREIQFTQYSLRYSKITILKEQKGTKIAKAFESQIDGQTTLLGKESHSLSPPQDFCRCSIQDISKDAKLEICSNEWQSA